MDSPSDHEGTLVERKLLYHGRIIDLNLDTVATPVGPRTYEVVTHEGAAVVIPRLDAHRVILVEQWRHSVGQRLWEVPAGLIDSQESPEGGARRELREETGYLAGRLERLWSTYSVPGFCTELLHFYVADDLELGEREPDEGEESMIVRAFHLEELQAMITREEIIDMKTILAVLWAQLNPLSR